MGERASIFDDSADFDVSGFTPKKPVAAKADPGPAPEDIRAVSENANFRSRDPGPLQKKSPGIAKRKPRLHRTGRSTQFNVKLRADSVESFYALADRQGWTLGETVENALAALQKQLGM